MEQRVSLATYALLTQGRPAPIEQIAESSGIAIDFVRQVIKTLPGTKHDAEGAVTGHWGLTIRETKHLLHVGGRQLYTWCAWDTIFLPPLLRTTADVESSCPTSGERIALRISSAGIEVAYPETVVLSFLLPQSSGVERNVIEHFCQHVHFFRSVADGEEWTSTRPKSFLVSLNDAWRIGVRKNFERYPLLAQSASHSGSNHLIQ